jgi:hypothetical protein
LRLMGDVQVFYWPVYVTLLGVHFWYHIAEAGANPITQLAYVSQWIYVCGVSSQSRNGYRWVRSNLSFFFVRNRPWVCCNWSCSPKDMGKAIRINTLPTKGADAEIPHSNIGSFITRARDRF